MSSSPDLPESPTLLQQLLSRQPQIAAIGDHVIDDAAADDDDLLADIVPLFDILRHPQTRGPLRIALMGRPGCGKTSALQWLRRSLNAWNRSALAKTQDNRIAAVDFNASAFSTPDEARRGMLAEILLATTGVATAGVDAIRRAIHDFGPYFGRSFVLALAAQKLDSGAPIGAKEKAELAALESALDEYPARSATESLSLSAFQSRFANSLSRALGANTRLVVLVDDLERTRADVQPAVLDTIRLQLRLPNVFVVIALDHQQTIGAARHENGTAIDPTFFHIKCEMAPEETALLRYSHRALSDAWPTDTKGSLPAEAMMLYSRLGYELADHTPLGLKRFWNRAVLASASLASNASEAGGATLSAFLLCELLQRRYRFGTLAEQHFGVEFLQALANVAAKHPSERAQFDVRAQGAESRDRNDTVNTPRGRWEVTLTAGNANVWRSIADFLSNHPRAIELAAIARDVDVLDLLKLGAVAPLSNQSQARPIGRLRDLEAGIVDEAILRDARAFGGERRAVAHAEVFSLDLAGLEIASLDSLRHYPNLKRLNLAKTLVMDLGPLTNLTALERLDLSETGVADLAPLSNLRALSHLQLGCTRVSNAAPLTGLPLLRELDLSQTLLHDVSSLAGLAALMRLSLARTRISDISGLTLLPELLVLDLHGTAVEDTIPLANLKTLTHLDLGETAIEFVAPIARLHELRSLLLNGTRLTDLSRIATLKNLIRLDVGDTHVSDISALAEMASLEALELANLPLQNADPLGSLIDLRILSIAGTQIRDLAPIGKLRHLVTLDIRNTPAESLEPLKGCLSLKSLIVSRESFDAGARAALISRNPRLRIVEE